MASSSGNSCGSSEEEIQAVVIEERKRKRMQSNRESARRSRMRKQQHLDELVGKASELRRDNARIAAEVGVTERHLRSVEAENSVLRAQMAELTHRLNSLNDIVGFIDSNSGGCGTGTAVLECGTIGLETSFVMDSLARFSHYPIMANLASSASDLMYY